MFDFSPITDRIGDPGTAAAVGAVAGLSFGFLAQRSRFCLRSAVSEIGSGKPGHSFAVWLAAFGAAILATQYLAARGSLELAAIRQLNEATSLSGAIAGGLLFGVGMVLARGCSSRHLILAAGGNLRAAVVFILFGLTAVATIYGPLAAPSRAISQLWTLSPANADLLANFGAGPATGIGLGLALVVLATGIAVRNRTSARMLVGGTAIGGVVALTWGLTSTLSQHTFEPTQVESISFTGPAAHVISFIWSSGAQAPSFDTGFIPAVAIGAFAASLLFGEFRLQWFDGLWSAATYGAGAVLMGFGGAMAVGCAVGNLATAAVMITASWVAVAAIAAGAILALKAQRLLERGVMCLDGGAWSSGYPRFRPKYEDAASPAPAAINTAAMP